MSDFTKAPNIGNILAKRLTDIGISNIDDLRAVGSKEVFLRLRVIDPTTCVNTLCAVEGAIQGIRWHHLDAQTKEDLKQFYASVVSMRPNDLTDKS